MQGPGISIGIFGPPTLSLKFSVPLVSVPVGCWSFVITERHGTLPWLAGQCRAVWSDTYQGAAEGDRVPHPKGAFQQRRCFPQNGHDGEKWDGRVGFIMVLKFSNDGAYFVSWQNSATWPF